MPGGRAAVRQPEITEMPLSVATEVSPVRGLEVMQTTPLGTFTSPMALLVLLVLPLNSDTALPLPT